MSAIPDIQEGAKAFGKLVRTLGAVTVAFFILLFSFIYIVFIRGEQTIASVEANSSKIDQLDTKVTEMIKNYDADRAVSAYFLREICKHGAKTELEEQSCNPPPALIQSSFTVR